MHRVIKKDANNVFYAVDGIINLIPIHFGMDFYSSSGSPHDQRYEDAACVWPFHEGFARVLGRDGKWGFIDENDLSICWLENIVLYADDFSCGLARVQFVDESFNYLKKDFTWMSQVNYNEASIFVNDLAVVSDSICSNFHIGVNGKITDDDLERYKKAKNERRTLGDYLKTRKNSGTLDPETAIMDTLCGSGDSDLLGF